MRILMALTKPLEQDGRVRREAAALRAAGHEVHVLEWARHGQSPGERTCDGVPVHPVHAGAGMGALRGNPRWWAAGTRRALELHAERPFDAFHAHDLDTLPVGVRFKRRTGALLVFDAHERFSLMAREGAGPLVALAAEALERRCLKHCDRVVTVTPGMAEHYGRRVPTALVMNCGEPPARGTPPAPTGPPCYVGTLEARRLLPGLVDAFGAAGVPLDVAGKREALYDAVAAAAARHATVRFLGALSHDDAVAVIAASAVVLCPLDPGSRAMRTALATKVFDAMAHGRPCIVSAGTETARIVAEHDAGRVVPHRADAFVAAARELLADPKEAARLGANGRAAAKSLYHWAAQAGSLVSMYADLPPLATPSL